MASTNAKGKRNFIARTRVENVIARLSAQFGIERVAPGRNIRDKELAQIVQLEVTADFLEALEIKLNGEAEFSEQSDLQQGEVADESKLAEAKENGEIAEITEDEETQTDEVDEPQEPNTDQVADKPSKTSKKKAVTK